MRASREELAWRAVAFFAGVILTALLLVVFRQTRPAGINITPPAPTTSPEPTVTPSPINIDVKGEVMNSAVYELPAGGIVQDAINAAGGFTERADRDRVNLAQPLSNGMQIIVPAAGEEPSLPVITRGESANPGLFGGLININVATVEELQALPGIGPSIAQRIVDYRLANGLFSTLEDLIGVNGIGETTFEEIEDLITID